MGFLEAKYLSSDIPTLTLALRDYTSGAKDTQYTIIKLALLTIGKIRGKTSDHTCTMADLAKEFAHVQVIDYLKEQMSKRK